MEPVLPSLQSQLEEIKATLMELKAENALLRNEILGTGNSASTTAECVGILEKKTLREFVEEIQFDVKSIQTKIENGDHASKSVEGQHPSTPDRTECTRNSDFKKTANIPAGFLREFPVVEIKQKTIEDERAWIKQNFREERTKTADPANGASLVGGSVESILSNKSGNPTCVLQLSNHLNSALMDPQEFVRWGTCRTSGKYGHPTSGPTNAIVGHSSEVFSYKGNGIHTQFLRSFQVTKDLRLAIALFSWRHERTLTVNLGFVPDDIPTGLRLVHDMYPNLYNPVPDISGGDAEHAGVEYFINHGNLLARAQVSKGPGEWMVNLDILQGVPASSPRCVRIPYAPNDLAGLVEISNCLDVSLKNPRRFTHKDGINEALPAEVLPFTREALFSSEHTDLEGMFSYEISSTDLGLAAAFRFQGTNSAFSAAFVVLPAETDENTFNLAMDPEQWKSRLYRKYAQSLFKHEFMLEPGICRMYYRVTFIQCLSKSRDPGESYQD